MLLLDWFVREGGIIFCYFCDEGRQNPASQGELDWSPIIHEGSIEEITISYLQYD